MEKGFDKSFKYCNNNNCIKNLQNTFCVVGIVEYKHWEHKDTSYINLAMEKPPHLGEVLLHLRKVLNTTETKTKHRTSQNWGGEADYTKKTIINILIQMEKVL